MSKEAGMKEVARWRQVVEENTKLSLKKPEIMVKKRVTAVSESTHYNPDRVYNASETQQ